ncbi:hypothetical protein SAMN02744035_03657, partial [Thalassobacter stenotrophicus DSM 16310]
RRRCPAAHRNPLPRWLHVVNPLMMGFVQQSRVLQKDGTIALKHEIYAEEDKSSIKGKTAINTALANVFSKHNETKSKTKKQADAEADAANSSDTVAQYIEDEKQAAESINDKAALAA